MTTFFKNKAAIALLLLMTGGIYGCGHGSKPGSTVNDTSNPIDTAQIVDNVKSSPHTKHHHMVKKHKSKPDTLNVVAEAKSATLPPVAGTAKVDGTNKTFPGKIPNSGAYISNVNHFIMRRKPVTTVLKQPMQEFFLVRRREVINPDIITRPQPTPAPAPPIPQTSPAPAPPPPAPIPVPVPIAPVAKPKDLKFGILGYSYPPNIIVGESKDIHAFISIVYPTSKVKDTLLKISVADDPANSTDSISIFEPIRLYKYVTLTLTPTDSSIRVTDYPQVDAKQQIDTLEGNKWSWGILATSADNPVSKLKLIISTEDPENYEEKTIPIYIKVNPHFFRKVYDFLMGDPNVLVVSILIPLATFIGGLLFAKRKRKA